MKKVRVRSKHPYANEELLLFAQKKELWIDRCSTTVGGQYAVIQLSPKAARRLAHWILEQYPEA